MCQSMLPGTIRIESSEQSFATETEMEKDRKNQLPGIRRCSNCFGGCTHDVHAGSIAESVPVQRLLLLSMAQMLYGIRPD